MVKNHILIILKKKIMTTTFKTPRRKKNNVTHLCVQEDILKRHDVLLERQGTVLLGNGHPEDGLLFMFREFLEREKKRKEDIAEIKLKIENALSATATTQKALDMYKAEMGGIDKGESDTIEKQKIADELKRTKARDNRFVIFQVIALCLTMCGVAAAVYFGFRNGQKTDVVLSNEKAQTEVVK